MNKAEKLIKLVGVPERVKELTGINISRQTVYNWASKGRKMGGECFRLKVRLHVGQLFTTEKWIRNFLTEIGE